MSAAAAACNIENDNAGAPYASRREPCHRGEGSKLHWTEAQTATLIRLHAMGAVSEDIAAEIGFTTRQIRNRAYRLGLDFAQRPSDWTPDKVDGLKKLHSERKTFLEISQILGIGRSACIGKAHRLKLKPNPTHPPRTD